MAGLGATALLYLWAPAAGDLGGHGSAGCRVTAGTGLAPRCRHSLCPEMTNFSASPLPAQHKTDTCEDDHYFPTEPHRRIKGARRGLPTRGHQSESQSLLGRGHLRAGRALQSSLGPPRPSFESKLRVPSYHVRVYATEPVSQTCIANYIASAHQHAAPLPSMCSPPCFPQRSLHCHALFITASSATRQAE